MPGAEGADGPQGQWIHARLFGVSLPAASQLSLGEGMTPLAAAAELGSELGIPNLMLKREDLSPTGSHKARSLSLLCSVLLASGGRQAVISSSGNAAIAAAAYASLAGLRMLSLVSPRTPRLKLQRLEIYQQLTVLSDRPVGLLHHGVRDWGLSDLRGSVNLLAPNAYRGIAAELVQEEPLAAVFVFSSSGACALGIAQGMEQLLAPGQRPALHVVEGAPGGELTRPWYPSSHQQLREESLPGELGTHRSRRAPALRREVRRSGGRGWRVGAREAEEVREVAARHGVRTSWEGLATLAAMRQAAASAPPVAEGRWVAVLTGDESQLDQEPRQHSGDPPLPTANTEEELDRLLEGAAFTKPGSP
ncbi:MAG TPA: pyridoxal-phosphate dependent enzyme [Candidatus Dormibacteraeota bacterium]|nr:pyridoxal-phosphate dependent enzyme [Candidatus Dormibacteraeota bacterium]